MLGYMPAIITQKKIPKIEEEIEKWKKDLASCKKEYELHGRGEEFIQSLYELIACIENLKRNKDSNESRASVPWEEKKTLNELLINELHEVARNIEGPLYTIIEDSAKQMDNCRVKIIPYAGIWTTHFKDSTDSTDSTDPMGLIEPDEKSVLNSTIEPLTDYKSAPELNKFSGALKWIQISQTKFSIGSAGTIVAVLLLAIILTGVILKFSP